MLSPINYRDKCPSLSTGMSTIATNKTNTRMVPVPVAKWEDEKTRVGLVDRKTLHITQHYSIHQMLESDFVDLNLYIKQFTFHTVSRKNFRAHPGHFLRGLQMLM